MPTATSRASVPTGTRPETRFVTAGGRRLRLRLAGPQGGVPLLILNGSGSNLEVVDRLVAEIAPRRRIVVFDQPGMGRSPAVLPTLSVPGLAALAIDVLDTLGIGRADILGYSFGGAIAEQLALASPDRVGRLVLLAGTFGLGTIPPDPFTASAVLAHACPGGRRVRAPARRAYRGGVLRREEEMRAFERAVRAAPPDPVSFAGQAAAETTWSALPALWAIRAPTLVLSGDEDLVVPVANARILAALIPRARLEILPGEGHLVVFDAAAHVGARVDAFLSSPSEAPLPQ